MSITLSNACRLTIKAPRSRFKCSWAQHKKPSLAIVGVLSFERYLKRRLKTKDHWNAAWVDSATVGVLGFGAKLTVVQWEYKE